MATQGSTSSHYNYYIISASLEKLLLTGWWGRSASVHCLELSVSAVHPRDVLQGLLQLLGPRGLRVVLRWACLQVELCGLNVEGLLAWLFVQLRW